MPNRPENPLRTPPGLDPAADLDATEEATAAPARAQPVPTPANGEEDQETVAATKMPEAEPPSNYTPATQVLSTEAALDSAGLKQTANKSAGSWGTMPGDGQFETGQLIFGRYNVIRMLGRGGMGAVWLVRHVHLDVERALKLIVAGIAHDPQARGRFEREARIMAKVSKHPNAVAVHDARLTESDVAYIEMEYVEGQSLDKVYKKGHPMPVDWVARILAQLCSVLQYAHDNNIVHRDLKPSNLMLLDGRSEGEEHLKVLDFGIAKVLGAEEREGDARTVTGAFMGTPPYTSPEQSEGHADHRSDIYSTGVILYEFLTGHRPFSGYPTKMILDSINVPPPKFKEINPECNVPADVEAVVMRCLAKKAEDRPQSARELAQEFAIAYPLVGVVQVPPPPRPWFRTPEFMTIITVCASLSVLGGLFLNRPKPTPAGLQQNLQPGSRWPALPDGYEAAKDAEPADDGLPSVISRKKDGVRFIRIPGSDAFVLGFTGEEAKAAPKVKVKGFYMQETEVTNGEIRAYYSGRPLPPEFQQAYELLLNKHGLKEGEANLHPAVGISHEVASQYATHVGGRLPTTIEWEYASRSGGKDDRPYVWAGEKAPVEDDTRAQIDAYNKPGPPTAPVKYFNGDKTDQGVYDMTGNVREWCFEQETRTVEGMPIQECAVRGGAWDSMAAEFKTTLRLPPEACDKAAPNLGFRPVLEWPKAK